jgi:NDP-sugar pyrophosphorylase family protein
MKKRISLTLDKELLKQLDKFIDKVSFESRSSFIEFCIRKYIENSNIAVILAGGNPRKLKIKGRFKFLIPLKNNKTLLDLLFEKLTNFGKIYVIGQKEVIDACFEKLGNKINSTEIEYIEEKKELGNAKTLELIKNKVSNTFLILPIDQYFEFDFFDLMRKHNLNRAIYKNIVTLTVSPISTKEKYGSIAMVGSRIVKHEEGKKGEKNLISAFAAVCDKKIFNYIPKGEIRWILQENVYPKLINQEKMSGYLLDTPIFNVHTEKDISILRKYLNRNI